MNEKYELLRPVVERATNSKKNTQKAANAEKAMNAQKAQEEGYDYVS